MIEVRNKGMMTSDVDLLVCPSNTNADMNSGIPRLFHTHFPITQSHYTKLCGLRTVELGHAVVCQIVSNECVLKNKKYVANLAVRNNEKQACEIESVISALYELRAFIIENNINSVAIPALGCAHGGLQWLDVKSEIEKIMVNMGNLVIFVYPPFCEA